MKNINLFFLFVCASLAVTYYSCKEEEEIDTNTQAAVDDATAETIFNDVYYQVSNSAKEDSTINKTGLVMGDSTCGTITIKDSLGAFPVTVTLNFGDSNQLCFDGHYRKGIIKAVFTGRYKDSGTVITITLYNYYVDSHLIQGTKKFTNNGRNSSSNLSYTIEVTNASIATDSGTISWQSNRTHEWKQGENTRFVICDDVYSITGTASGIDRKGLSYILTITEPLKKQTCCRWIMSGKLEISPANKVKRYVDFGGGTCDHYAQVTINSRTFDFILP